MSSAKQSTIESITTIPTQVKHCINEFPFHFADREVIELTVYKTLSRRDFFIYRIEFGDSDVGECYLDLITDSSNKYITFGGGDLSTFSNDVAKQICESYSLISRLETI